MIQPASPLARSGAHVEALEVSAYTVPTDGPGGEETDGTLGWSSTTLVLVELWAGGVSGLGYTYTDAAAAALITTQLAEVVLGRDPLLVGELWREMRTALRNTGVPGLGAMAIAAVDVALWDARAKLLELPLFLAVGGYRRAVPIYGSGGFTNLPLARLREQVAGWVAAGIPRVKVKTSRHPEEDPARLAACRQAIGPGPALMADANGALTRKEAQRWAWRLREEWGVDWLEEPVSSDDREGLRLVRDAGPPGLEVAAGEYGYLLGDFQDLLAAGAVDCLQADVTRCQGITGLLQVGGLASAHAIDLSGHCAPAISAHALCGVERTRHLEWFHDHVRVERLLFDGVLTPREGCLHPDPSRPGLGLLLKRQDAERWLVHRERAGRAGVRRGGRR